ncbi:10929_t:CDS:2 [Paraglomus brasilianum]|uniref:10929_t:CDS:1 n=1 Tax=Paraglomus brasilianum TaxID=144538 RepID=A0A9N9FXN5_9GLOM|nr:10929_t:CDS:2 [Paraglomus brasilianum]
MASVSVDEMYVFAHSCTVRTFKRKDTKSDSSEVSPLEQVLRHKRKHIPDANTQNFKMRLFDINSDNEDTNDDRDKRESEEEDEDRLSSIVDLSSEFDGGMWTFFKKDWEDIKTMVYSQLNLAPCKFKGAIHEIVKTIEEMCAVYKYWEAQKHILDEMKQSDSYDIKYQQILKTYFIVLDMFSKKKLTEMEYIFK